MKQSPKQFEPIERRIFWDVLIEEAGSTVRQASRRAGVGMKLGDAEVARVEALMGWCGE